MRLFSLLLAGMLLGAGITAQAADIEGHVTINHRGAAREAVVYFEGEKKAVPLSKAVIDQRQKTFIPHILVVPVGTNIQFPNNDTVFHNVFAYFDAKKFDLGMYPHGTTKTIKFDKKGLVSLLCNVHSDMSAYIMVVDTPYYAITDKQGHFQIKDMPPGTYVLRAWHESGYTLTQTITIKAEENPLDLTLTRK
jgi:plastocyanin